jgi:hypothetical protein
MKTPLLRRTPKSAELPFDIEVSFLARRYVRQQGGQVFVWHADVGGTYVLEKASCATPAGDRAFDQYDAGEFLIFLECDYAVPERVRLSRTSWPFAPLSIPTTEDTGALVDTFRNPPGTSG